MQQNKSLAPVCRIWKSNLFVNDFPGVDLRVLQKVLYSHNLISHTSLFMVNRRGFRDMWFLPFSEQTELTLISNCMFVASSLVK